MSQWSQNSGQIAIIQKNVARQGLINMRYFASRSMLFRVGLASCLSAVLGWSLPAIALEQLNLPDNLGLPGRREGGGTRSPCLIQDSPHIQAIVPKSLVGKTASANPTFYVYIPPNTAQGAEFGIEDANGKELYSQTIQQSITSGIISFNLPPEQMAQLQPGQDYYWYFQLICDANINQGIGSRDDFAEGWIHRVELDESFQRTLAQTAPRDRINLYAKEGLWYELLDTLAQLRRDATTDTPQAEAEWYSILRHEQVQLNELVQQPLVACCTPNAERPATSRR
uniref:DUF928 domain-containing protein n=1 Tax=Desertifilum tharense IPPAS B-1220 TaxID=1781255 RepID=A0ACD5GNS0_9CYAN